VSPGDVGDMSLSEFFVAMHGLSSLRSGRPQPMSDSDFDDGIAALRSVAGDDVRI